MLELETSLRWYSKKINDIGRIIGSNITYGENEKNGWEVGTPSFLAENMEEKKSSLLFKKKKRGKFRDHKRSNYQYNISPNINHLLVIFW